MTGALVTLAGGFIGVVLFLKLLAMLAQADPPGPKSTKYWAGVLLLVACVVATIVASQAISGTWKP